MNVGVARGIGPSNRAYPVVLFPELLIEIEPEPRLSELSDDERQRYVEVACHKAVSEPAARNRDAVLCSVVPRRASISEHAVF